MTAAWHVATVVAARPETASARRIELEVPGWPGNDAGQHLDVRLTAPDGYQASRSYSIASAGPSTRVELAVDRLPDGEVSPFLVDELAVGDQLEVHGPLGGYFVWRPGSEPERPVQLIAGGSGVVPLLAMVRAHAGSGDPTPFRLLYSVRTPDDVFYRNELQQAADGSPLELDLVYTRTSPPGATRPAGRLTRETLTESVEPAQRRPRVFICGSTGFVEQVAVWLQELGHAAADIRTERFGGT
ncbi:ferredoxin reductase [Pseudolysinimonas kribbensis]|uniref:Oxidoreductase n=1 Tax=Pseudolysinimonas kribbensis TaxID=433641 RepID=A0ABQ6K342_9MICO|nr:ferredoxin reductase [Pseudolysinimonas kribbensis]GMA94156.1 oxidoreductase [Pseudolysinimonas kribbensis]